MLTPIFENQFHEHSYCLRADQSEQQAVIKALKMINERDKWIVDIDFQKLFETVDYDKLMTELVGLLRMRMQSLL